MPKCVVFSDRAFTSLLVETLEKIKTETGGVFLGYKKGDIWYVIESIDPGLKSTFQPTYFEYDQDYVNHLINKVSRIYKEPLDLLGLWHRHPGSLDVFSATDDGTNTKYAELYSSGAISALVNIDPDFRITMYSVKLPLHYEKIKVRIGDKNIPKGLLMLKSGESLLKSINSNKAYTPKRRMLSHINEETKRNDNKLRLSQKKSFSFSNSIEIFLEKRTISNSKRIKVYIEEEKFEESVELILKALDSDLKYLESLGIQCLIKVEDNLLCVYENEGSYNGVSLLFGMNSEEKIFLTLDKKTYKYYSGMFEDACVEYISGAE